MIDLTIGIVTFNGKALLAQCLESIRQAPPRCEFEILVVDNASSDGTVGWLQHTYPQVRLQINMENAGIARGNNQCLQAAKGRYLLLLNNDTIVLPSTLDRMVAFADEYADAGAVGGRLINPDGSFQASYFCFPNLRWEFLHATHLWSLFLPTYPSQPDCQELRQVDWICSASLLVRRSAAEQVGGVDENFIMYSDETDLQYRMNRAGWKVYFLPDVSTIHFGGQSTSHWRRRKMIYRGKLLFFQKHYGPLRTAIVRALFATTSAAKLPLWLAAGVRPQWRDRANNEFSSDLEVVRDSLAIQS